MKLRRDRNGTLAGFAEALPSIADSLTRRVAGSPCGFTFANVARGCRRLLLGTTLLGGVSRFLLRLNANFTCIKGRCHLRVKRGRGFVSLLFCGLGLSYCIIVRIGVNRFSFRSTKRLDKCIMTYGRVLHGRNHSGPAVKLLVYHRGSSLLTRCTLRNDDRPLKVSRCRLSGLCPRGIRKAVPAVRRVRGGLSKRGR